MDNSKSLLQAIERLKESGDISDEQKQVLENFIKIGSLSVEDEEETDYSAPVAGLVYRIRVDIKRAKPPIWRRLLVSDDITLHQLHLIIQAAFGWSDTHLYSFRLGNTFFELPEEEGLLPNFREIHDSKEVLLGNVLSEEGEKLEYTYDFRSNWEHVILLEKMEKEKIRSAKCLTGRRAAPVEGSRGIEHYQQLLKLIDDPSVNNEQIDFYRGFFEGHDSEQFDLRETNRALRELDL